MKKSEFQKEIEADEKRLEEIYNKILRMYKPAKSSEMIEKELMVN